MSFKLISKNWTPSTLTNTAKPKNQNFSPPPAQENLRENLPPQYTQEKPHNSPIHSNEPEREIYKNRDPIPPQESEEISGKINLPEDKTDWEKKLGEHRKTLELEEEERRKRIQTRQKLENSWELAKLCRSFIRENSKNWKGDLEENRKKREKETEREERKMRAEKKRGETLKKLTQKKITDTLRKLPAKERENIRQEEDKLRRLEIKEMKEKGRKKEERKQEKGNLKRRIGEKIRNIGRIT